MPFVMLILAVVAVLALLLFVVIRLNDLEKEVGTLVARTRKHYESR